MLKSPDEMVNLAHLYLGSEFCSEDPAEMQAVMDLFLGQKECVTTYSSEGINDRLMNKDVIMHAHPGPGGSGCAIGHAPIGPPAQF